MADQKLIEEVGKYIDKYYKPAYSDICLLYTSDAADEL